MGDRSHCIETALHNDHVVRVEFSPINFRHRIELLRGGDVIACLTEVESPDAGPWLPSPPWQELHVHEQTSGEQVLMLVGRAGTSHWSMAVSRDDSQRVIVFDVACRVRQQPEFLGTTYRHMGSQRVLQIQSLAVDDGSTSKVERNVATVVVRSMHNVSPPTTIRWKYAVSCAD